MNNSVINFINVIVHIVYIVIIINHCVAHLCQQLHHLRHGRSRWDRFFDRNLDLDCSTIVINVKLTVSKTLSLNVCANIHIVLVFISRGFVQEYKDPKDNLTAYITLMQYVYAGALAYVCYQMSVNLRQRNQCQAVMADP